MIGQMSITVLALLLAAAPHHATPADGESIVRTMRERGAAHSYQSLSFVQTTTFPDRPSETWYESLQAPGLLRIDVAPLGSRTMLFRNDSTYGFRDGKPGRKGPYVHPLMVLLTDVYVLPAERTIARLKALGFDLSRSHDETWNGEAVHVVGALAGDTVSSQFWIDRSELGLLRMIEKSTNGERMESQVTKRVRFGKALVETEMHFLVNGKEIQREVYTQVTVNPKFDAGIFDPEKNVTPTWISAIR